MKQRIVFLDFLRVVACFLVILIHTCEPYYLGPNDTIAFSDSADRLWVAIIDGACRASVPLFVMTSSYLLLPLKTGGTDFFRKRGKRIFLPFLFWSVFYAIIPVLQAGGSSDAIIEKVTRLLYTFNNEGGHLWYIWMLAGIYLIMPVISPWLQKTSKRGELIFIGIWIVASCYYYLRPWLGPLWGQAAWNEFHALYYYSGYIGYVVLAHYIRFRINWSARKTMATGITSLIVGYILTAGIWYNHAGISTDYAFVEQPWHFCTVNIIMMTFGTFLIFKCIRTAPAFLYKPFEDMSKLSYGIYLIHIFMLGIAYSIIGTAMFTPMNILIVATTTFLLSYITCKLLSFIPGGKYIIG